MHRDQQIYDDTNIKFISYYLNEQLICVYMDVFQFILKPMNLDENLTKRIEFEMNLNLITGTPIKCPKFKYVYTE